MTDRTEHAKREARVEAEAATDTEVAAMLVRYAADIEAEGRARAPAWLREAARRLRRLRVVEGGRP